MQQQQFSHPHTNKNCIADGPRSIKIVQSMHVSFDTSSKLFSFSGANKPIPMTLKSWKKEGMVLFMEEELNNNIKFQKFIRNDGRRSEMMKLCILKDDMDWRPVLTFIKSGIGLVILTICSLARHPPALQVPYRDHGQL